MNLLRVVGGGKLLSLLKGRTARFLSAFSSDSQGCKSIAVQICIFAVFQSCSL